MEIIWTDRAYYSYDNNIDYLLKEWSIEVVKNFISKTEETEKLLVKNPHLGRFDEDLKLYKLLVVKQIYLFYEIQGNHIVIIDF